MQLVYWQFQCHEKMCKLGLLCGLWEHFLPDALPDTTMHTYRMDWIPDWRIRVHRINHLVKVIKCTQKHSISHQATQYTGKSDCLITLSDDIRPNISDNNGLRSIHTHAVLLKY